MKKTLLIVLMAFAGITASMAQDLGFIVKGGIGISNFTGDLNGSTLFSWKMGVTGDFAVSDFLGIQPGLMFTRKGTSDPENIGDATVNAYYLEVPVMAAYRIPLPRTMLLLNAGPYLACGVGGKTKIDMPEGGTYEVDTFGSEGLKRFDFGMGLGIGFDFEHITAGIEADFGFLNVADSPRAKARNMSAHITVGYRF